MKLTAENVLAVFTKCLFKETESPVDTPPVVAHACLLNIGFHPVRIKEARADIASMISQVQEPFFADSGGGWSFLNLCMTADNTLWGQHIDCDRLLALGLATDLASYPLARDMWEVLPGSMPYITFIREVVKSN